MSTLNFMLSGSDEEILNAMRMANDIVTEVNSSASNHTHYEASGSSDAYHNFGLPSVFVSDFSEDSGCPKLQEFSKTVNDEKNKFNLESEYQNLLQGISSLQLMCDLTIEGNRRAEAEVNNVIKNNVENSQQVLSVPMLSENLESTNSTLNHMQVNIKQISGIKQLLGNEYKKTLKINPPSQKEAIEFLNLTSELIRNVEKDMASIEACLISGGDNWNQTRTQLQHQISKSNKDLQRRLDAMIEFRDNIKLLYPGGIYCLHTTPEANVESSCFNPLPDSMEEVIYDSS